MKWFFVQPGCALAVVWLLAGTAHACSCLAIPTPYESFKMAPVVFVGRVTSSADAPFTERFREKEFTYHERHYRFTVEEAFKGVKGGEVTVSAGRTDSSCFSGFEVGRSYLIYAGGRPETMLYSGVCSRDSELGHAQDDIHYLRQLLKGAPEPRVYGSVTRIDTDFRASRSSVATPLEGVKVVVEGGGRRFEAVTDKQGLFSLDKVPDGTYKARPVLPDRYRIGWPAEQEFVLAAADGYVPSDVHRGPTAFVSFRAAWGNEIGGNILDAEGNPVKRAKASLLFAAKPGEEPLLLREDAHNLAEGKYRFTGLTPGRYLPALSIRAPFKTARPTRFFFPGVTDAAAASEITVGDTDSLSNRDFRLPPDYLVRPVEGEVVGADGVPVANAWTCLSESENPEDYEKNIDCGNAEHGRFSLQGFVGAAYWLHVSGRGNDRRARSVRVEVGKANEPLRIVLPGPKQ